MQLSTSIDFNGDLPTLVSTAQNLEAAGIDVLWTAEINGFDAVSTEALLVGKTERVKLMTGIIPLYSRSPALIAQTAATLSEMSGGRFILGLGSSGPQVIEGWHGVPFGKPLQRTRATIDICQSIWSGEKVAYDGPGYQLPLTGENTTGLGKALRFMGPPPTHPIPIALAAIGPRNVELTAAVADIWQTAHFVPGSNATAGKTKQPRSKTSSSSDDAKKPTQPSQMSTSISPPSSAMKTTSGAVLMRTELLA